jgi:Na+-transporting methylmalonyl-CoA/oxaloacetate decarboxylase gamma subunit
MKTKFRLSLIGLILLIAVISVTAKLVRTSIDSENVSPATIEPVKTAQTNDEAPANIQVVLLTLRSEGFEPAELQLAAGEYLLVVRNRTGLDEVDVSLVRENGQHLGQSKVGARQKDWKQRLKLTPGTYLLNETNHPDWTLRVVVDK